MPGGSPSPTPTPTYTEERGDYPLSALLYYISKGEGEEASEWFSYAM